MSRSPSLRRQAGASVTLRTIALPRDTRLGFTRSEWQIIAVALGLHGMTNGLLPARYHIPASLLTSTLASVLAAKSGAGRDEQGLAPRAASLGVAYGLAAASAI